MVYIYIFYVCMVWSSLPLFSFFHIAVCAWMIFSVAVFVPEGGTNKWLVVWCFSHHHGDGENRGRSRKKKTSHHHHHHYLCKVGWTIRKGKVKGWEGKGREDRRERENDVYYSSFLAMVARFLRQNNKKIVYAKTAAVNAPNMYTDLMVCSVFSCKMRFNTSCMLNSPSPNW